MKGFGYLMHLQIALTVPECLILPSSHTDIMLTSVYDTLKVSNPDLVDEFHFGGVDIDGDKVTNRSYRRNLKLFTFSGLRGSFESNNRMLYFDGPKVWWRVASALNSFTDAIEEGAKSLGYIKVANYRLPVERIDRMPSPQWSSGRNKFVCLSPIVAPIHKGATDETVYFCRGCRERYAPRPETCPKCQSTFFMRETGYLVPGDDDYLPALTGSVISKYTALHGEPPTDRRFKIEFDEQYINRKNIVRSSWFRETRHTGVICPFSITGNKDLIDVAYNCGIGERNSTGFGMISPVALRG